MMRKTRSEAIAPEIPTPGEGKRGPKGHLGYLVRQANVAVRAAMEKALADLEVTPAQFAVLTMIVAYPGVSGADLARLTFLTPHAEHGRILRLNATTKGQALLKRCRSRVMDLEASLAGLVGREEERIIRRWLSAVAERLG